MDYSLLKDHIRRNVQISDAALDAICAYFKPQTIAKGAYLLTQGNVWQFEGFVIEGCFRVFTTNKEGNESTLYFAVKDWWLMDIDSFMNQTPSELTIQALASSDILLISRDDKELLYSQMPVVDKLFRVMSQKAVVAWQRRLIRNHNLTAKERYDYFLATYPHIASQLTDRNIASYLGITHEFLSKIKRKSSPSS